MGLSENVGLIFPKQIAIFHRDNDQQNHWVKRGTQHFQTNVAIENDPVEIVDFPSYNMGGIFPVRYVSPFTRG